MPGGFDFLGSAFLGPRGPGRDASPAEQLVAGITQLLFPTLVFCLVAFAGLWKNLTAASLLVLGLGVAGYLLARLLSVRIGFACLTTLAGLLWSFMAMLGAGLLAGLGDFFRAF